MNGYLWDLCVDDTPLRKLLFLWCEVLGLRDNFKVPHKFRMAARRTVIKYRSELFENQNGISSTQKHLSTEPGLNKN